MQINTRCLPFICCFLFLSAIAYNARSQTNTSCYDSYLSISKAYDAGDFAGMDSLFAAYQNSDCFTRNKAINVNTTISIYKIMIRERLQDEFRKNEADSLQLVLNNLEKHTSWQKLTSNYRDTSYSQWRIGPSASFNSSAIGSVGSSAGLTVGWRSQNFHKEGWGIDAGVFFQQIPFFISVIRANSITSRESLKAGGKPNGYDFKTSGKMSLYNFPVTLSYNLREADIGGFGMEVTAGVELLKTRTTYIKNKYNQYDYAAINDSDSYIVAENSVSRTNYYDNSLFKNQKYINSTLGFNIYWLLTNSFLISFSPEYSENVSGKVSLSDVNYTQPYNSFIMRVSFVYLFKKAKRKIKGRD